MCDGSFTKLQHVHDDKGTHFRSTGSVFRFTWCAELWLRHNAQELLLQLMISESGYPLWETPRCSHGWSSQLLAPQNVKESTWLECKQKNTCLLHCFCWGKWWAEVLCWFWHWSRWQQILMIFPLLISQWPNCGKPWIQRLQIWRYGSIAVNVTLCRTWVRSQSCLGTSSAQWLKLLFASRPSRLAPNPICRTRHS